MPEELDKPYGEYTRGEMMDSIQEMNDEIDTWRDPVDDWGIWSGAWLCAAHNPRDRIEMWIRDQNYPTRGNLECIQLARQIKLQFPGFGP